MQNFDYFHLTLFIYRGAEKPVEVMKMSKLWNNLILLIAVCKQNISWHKPVYHIKRIKLSLFAP